MPEPSLKNFTVPENPAGASWRLVDYLQKVFPEFKKTKLKQLLKFGSIAVNQKPATRHDHPLKPGDVLSVRTDKRSLRADRAEGGLQIIYEDSAIIVVDKPPKLLTIATDEVKDRTVYYKLNEYLKNVSPRKPERVFVVHRLDREASGILIFAKSQKVKQCLQDSWEFFEKKYYAVVEGTPSKASDTLQSYLSQTESLKVYSTEEETKNSKLAITKYQVIKRRGGYCSLDVTLLTGRKHQIRVQLADMGHPIIGDEKYGAETNPARRLGLHAYLLKITHPVTGEFLKFETKIPSTLSRVTGTG